MSPHNENTNNEGQVLYTCWVLNRGPLIIVKKKKKIKNNVQTLSSPTHSNCLFLFCCYKQHAVVPTKILCQQKTNMSVPHNQQWLCWTMCHILVKRMSRSANRRTCWNRPCQRWLASFLLSIKPLWLKEISTSHTHFARLRAVWKPHIMLRVCMTPQINKMVSHHEKFSLSLSLCSTFLVSQSTHTFTH